MKKTSVYVKILMIIIPVVAVTLIVMMAVTYHINFKSQKNFFEFCMQELSAKSAQEVTTKLSTMTEELKWVAAEEIFTSMDDSKYSKRLASIAADKKEYFSMMFVAYPDGSYYINGKGFSKANIADRQYFKNIFQRGYDFSMTSPDISKSTGEKKYTLAVPIKRDGKVVGAFCANVSLNTLITVVEECKFGNNGETFIVDEKAELIGSRMSDLIMNFNLTVEGKTALPGMEEVGEAVKRGENCIRYCKDAATGENMYTMSRKIEGTPGWFFFTMMSVTTDAEA